LRADPQLAPPLRRPGTDLPILVLERLDPDARGKPPNLRADDRGGFISDLVTRLSRIRGCSFG